MEFVFRQPTIMDDRNCKSRQSSNDRANSEPGWAKGLRKLYDSVVDEPLPDSFDDLLKKLDRGDNGKS